MIDCVAKGEIAREKRKAHGISRGIGRWFSKWPAWVYRLHLGWLLGHRFLLVTHRGRRSGMLRQTGVMVLHHDSYSHRICVVAAVCIRAIDHGANLARPSVRACCCRRLAHCVEMSNRKVRVGIFAGRK